MKALGTALVILGIAGIVFGVVGYDSQTTFLEVGTLKATATEHKKSPLACVAGAIALASGIVILLAPPKR